MRGVRDVSATVTVSEDEEMTLEELCKAAEEINDGWYDGQPIVWEDFIDRLEDQTGEDFGPVMFSAKIKAIQKHIRAYRRL